MTRKLFYENAYIKDFEAEIISCSENGNGTYGVILDRTAFFPEAGGQKADTGMIGNAEVKDVRETENGIIHITDRPAAAGETVRCRLNWDERFEKMQSHSGEHIISGLVHNEFGYENVGFHLEDDCVTFDFDGKISENDILRIEAAANDIIYEDRAIRTYFPDEDELKNITYRSKLELTHDVRIVEIEGLDRCACCAPHVSGTAQIGIIKILNFYPHRGGTRIEMVCGRRAFRDYSAIHAQNGQIMRILSSKRFETPDNVTVLQNALSALKSENRMFRNRLAVSNMKEYDVKGVKCLFTSGADYEGLRACINSADFAEYAIVFSENEDGLIYACESRNAQIKPFVTKINNILQGRGGGKDSYAQGKISCPADEIITRLQQSDF